MTRQEIIDNAPKGAKGYMVEGGKVYYFIKSNFGWRQVKGNLIQFDDSNVYHLIKPL
ncbi:hypothetical protein AVV48_gp25 [Acinetobacter phage phiAC-1]|uniref:hypothetical protein n=1 Tax=Acinetobacter phage phiAC-1 TaxID=1229760 RepID=UPI00028B15B9|nr:hypothetical protein AVV48_gp25 [Acinetobacter phage phiAC-1]AFU62274.1 hypothetical protein phiAC-1_0025 [Acinetobacter phage phiAC-1]